MLNNGFNVYQAFNFRKIKNLFMVSARFCEIYFILQVLLYIFLKKENFSPRIRLDLEECERVKYGRYMGSSRVSW